MELPKPGDKIGSNYRIVGILGRGGFATVYRAVDDLAARTVAVKVLTPAVGGYARDLVARFEREVESLAQLKSPNTVRLFEYGRSDSGLLFIVSEYIEGEDLSELLKRKRQLGSDVVRQVLTQVLQSLAEAHRIGLLHRDIKPENIRVVDADGELKVRLLDFGIARQAQKGDAPQITKTGELVGTPRYMSPEQLRFVDDLTPASDIYSLGIVAYEMLMGQVSMHGHRLTDQVDRVATPDAFALPQMVEPRLREVVGRMVASEREERFQTAEEVLGALRGENVPVRVSTPWSNYVAPNHAAPLDEQTTRRYRRRSAVLLVAALAVIGVGVALWALGDDEPTSVVPPPKSKSIDALLKGSQPTEPDDRPAVEQSTAADVGADFGEPKVVWSPPESKRSAGCGRTDVPKLSQDILGKESIDNVAWNKKRYNPNKAYPVIILVHDTHETAIQVLQESGFGEISGADEAIIIGPRQKGWAQITRPLNGIWEPTFGRRVPAIVETVADRMCVDLGRIYAVGHGDGGDVVEALPCFMPGLRGIATVSHRPDDRIECGVPVPYLHYTGKLDGNLPADGNGCNKPVMGLEPFEEWWRERNGCELEAAPIEMQGGASCQSWSCSASFVSCHLDAGRGFPGSRPRQPVQFVGDPMGCDGPRPQRDLAREIWSHFKKLGEHK